MQNARSTIEDSEYTATRLSQFASFDRDSLKGHLACPYCFAIDFRQR